MIQVSDEDWSAFRQHIMNTCVWAVANPLLMQMAKIERGQANGPVPNLPPDLRAALEPKSEKRQGKQ
jgi:hypothetical protein